MLVWNEFNALKISDNFSCKLFHVFILLDFEAKWRCGKCKRTFMFKKIVNICNAVIRDIGTVEKQDNFKAYHNKFKEIIAKNKTKLHQTHGLMVYMKTYGLLTQYNNEFAIPPTISDKCIKDDLDVAKSMLKVLDIATPGQTAQRCKFNIIIVINQNVENIKYYFII